MGIAIATVTQLRQNTKVRWALWLQNHGPGAGISLPGNNAITDGNGVEVELLYHTLGPTCRLRRFCVALCQSGNGAIDER